MLNASGLLPCAMFRLLDVAISLCVLLDVRSWLFNTSESPGQESDTLLHPRKIADFCAFANRKLTLRRSELRLSASYARVELLTACDIGIVIRRTVCERDCPLGLLRLRVAGPELTCSGRWHRSTTLSRSSAKVFHLPHQLHFLPDRHLEHACVMLCTAVLACV